MQVTRRQAVFAIASVIAASGSSLGAVNYWDFNVLSGSTIGGPGQGYGSSFAGASGAVGDAWFVNMGLRTSGGASPSLPGGFYGGGDFTLSGGVHAGGIAVGGDVFMNNASVVGGVSAGGSLYGVGGSITGDATLGGVKVAGNQVSVSGSTWTNQTITVPVDLSAAASYFAAFSAHAASLAPTGTYTNQWGNLLINAADPVTVVEIAQGDFAGAWGISISGPGAVILNVAGDALSFGSKTWSYAGGASANQTVLNFAEASSVVMTGSHTVNMVAPNADTTFSSGTITGNLIVGSLMGSGSAAWNGGFQMSASFDVPAPGAAGVIAIAGAMVVARRRRV